MAITDRVLRRHVRRRLGRRLGFALILGVTVFAVAPITLAAAPIAWPIQGIGDRGTDVLAI
jgi:hypothetical protein